MFIIYSKLNTLIRLFIKTIYLSISDTEKLLILGNELRIYRCHVFIFVYGSGRRINVNNTGKKEERKENLTVV